ncbi:MAG TPA: hypothetical protein V6C97_03180 [Oculatellaceae cyanobacterium]
MGDGANRPVDQALNNPAKLASEHQITLSEQQWRMASPQKDTRQGLAQAQATGVEGTYGAPAMPPSDSHVTIPRKTSAVPSADTFKYNPTAPIDTSHPVASTQKSHFNPIPFDPDKRVGGDPWTQLPEHVARFLGPAVVGIPMTARRWAPELDRTFSFNAPEYAVAKNVSAATESTFLRSQKRAVPFLRSLKDSYNADPAVQAAEKLPPSARTTAQDQLLERAFNARNAWQAAKNAASGSNPVYAIDFRELAKDPKVHTPSAAAGWSAVTDFEKAQTALISERTTNIATQRTAEKAIFDGEIRAAKNGRLKDFGALGAAAVINLAVDEIAPRNDPSWLTVAGDMAAPAVMALELSGAGKWEPVIKAGVIVGTHLATHFLCDRNTENEKPKPRN